MAKLTAAEYAAKWRQRTNAAAPDYRRGIERVSEAPGEAAARQADAMLAGVQRAVSDGVWQRQVAKVSLQDWKNAAINKGAQRIAAGVDQAEGKMAQMGQQLLQAVDASVAVVNQIPKGGLENGIQRMTAFAREMHNRAPRRQG